MFFSGRRFYAHYLLWACHFCFCPWALETLWKRFAGGSHLCKMHSPAFAHASRHFDPPNFLGWTSPIHPISIFHRACHWSQGLSFSSRNRLSNTLSICQSFPQSLLGQRQIIQLYLSNYLASPLLFHLEHPPLDLFRLSLFTSPFSQPSPHLFSPFPNLWSVFLLCFGPGLFSLLPCHSRSSSPRTAHFLYLPWSYITPTPFFRFRPLSFYSFVTFSNWIK